MEIKRFLINFRYAFNPKKPLLTLRLIWNFIRILIFKKCLLRYVDLAIGYKCNLSCPHCFNNHQKRELGRMPPSHFVKVVKDAMRLGAVNFSFQGGEPLLYPDLKDYIKAARPSMNLISISTNGTLLTYQKAKELKSWGVDIVTISVDEFRKEQIKTQDGVSNAIRAGLKITIATVITHQSLNSEYSDFNRFLQEGWQASKIKFILMLIFAVPIGRWEGKDEVMLTKEDVKKVRDLEKKYSYIRTDMQANYWYWGCGAAKEIVYINPYGDVFACPFIQVPFGNLRRMSLWKIRERMFKIPMFQKYYPKCIAGEGGGLWRKL